MPDFDLIKAHYEKLVDSQLIVIAEKDGHALMPEAFQLLKAEFKKRNLDETPLIAVIEKKAQQYDEQKLTMEENNSATYEQRLLQYMLNETENEKSDADIIQGLCKKGMNEVGAKELIQSRENILQKMIDEHDTQMLTGGAFCVIGILVTLGTFAQANTSGGFFIVAWGAIIFGAIRFVKGFGEKRKWNRVLEIAKLNNEE